MHQITLDSQNATIDLNALFYPKHLLGQAAARFRQIAEVSVREENGRHLVTIKPAERGTAEETALEFCNYLLALKRELGEHA